MQCKNCQTPLQENNKFCASCGAKIINHRLNFKSVTEEFFATFISWDNKFFKTFAHLLTKPQEVTNGYLGGVRKRYMQPFAFLIVAFTVYGIYLFFAQDFINELLDSTITVASNQKTQEFNDKFGKIIKTGSVKYANILTFMLIPITALLTKLVFKKFNFIEHVIVLIYGNAHYIIVASITNAIAFLLGVNYTTLNIFTSTYMVFFFAYLFKKSFNLTKKQLVLKTLLLWLLFSVVFVFIILILVIIIAILIKLKMI